MTERAGNLPSRDEIFLDHVGHFVPDPRACEVALRSAGFIVTPFSAQVAPDPVTGRSELTGTGNLCVMLQSGYLEFLVHTADTPIGREFREALGRRPGLHLAAFAVPDAEGTHATLGAAGLDMRPLVHMSRAVETATGHAEARFTVARLQKGVMPEGRIQFLTHGSEAALWQERWLDHPNGALGLRSVVISSPDPSEAADRFSSVLARPATRTGTGAIRIELDRGAVEILAEDAATALVGMAVEPGSSAIVGYSLHVRDLAKAAAAFSRAGLSVRSREDHLIVRFPPELGAGTWILYPTR